MFAFISFCVFVVCVCVCVRATLIVCMCVCVCVYLCMWVGWAKCISCTQVRGTLIVTEQWVRLRTGEQTLLITQINKHADEQQQWNNGNTIGSVSSAADRQDNYGYPPTPSLPFKHPLLQLFFAHTSLHVFFIAAAHIFFLSCMLQWFLSLSVFLSLSFFLWHYLSTSYFSCN